MNRRLRIEAHVDDKGNLVLPEETVSRYGLGPNATTYIDKEPTGLHLHQPMSHLAKVYIEPTNRCNLDCVTCIRNVWDESLGYMSSSTFGRIMESLRSFSPPPSIFFGGLGEPLLHPEIVEMVAQAKALGSSVELITNGTLLTAELSLRLIEAGLDMLWVSLDGATPESYADVRLGAMLPKVLSNLADFQHIRLLRNVTPDCKSPGGYAFYEKPEIGIVFVAMKRNIAQLPALISLAHRFSVSRFMVTNVLPYTADMCKEVLYSRVLMDTPSMLKVELPRMDMDDATQGPLYTATRAGCTMVFPEGDLSAATNRCPFIEKGATAISWEGNVSPCLPLLHSYTTYISEREHYRRRYPVGSLNERDLESLWNEPEYVSFRERVKMFDFSPCAGCGSCDLSENNETDCIGSPFPTCGNCLWAQGLVQCP